MPEARRPRRRRSRADRAVTYGEIGATAWDILPTGYRQLQRRDRIGHGQQWFVEATQRLFTWDMHRRAGVLVDAESPVSLDQIATVRLRFWPITINAPVRVVSVIDDARERGFAYGTLPGHPEIGEERFVVRIDDDDLVWAEIRAFSRPGRWFTRLAGPVARRIQDLVTQRYVNALTDRD